MLLQIQRRDGDIFNQIERQGSVVRRLAANQRYILASLDEEAGSMLASGSNEKMAS
jgi:hypothetical protein